MLGLTKQPVFPVSLTTGNFDSIALFRMQAITHPALIFRLTGRFENPTSSHKSSYKVVITAYNRSLNPFV
jgi:hypothetical protein